MSLEALYWCASIFLWSFFTGIGLPPIPEEAGILYAASLATLHSEVRWWMAWPAASLGIIAADLALYGAGRLWGQRILAYRWLARVLTPERRKTIEDNFHRNGMKFLLTARLLPPLNRDAANSLQKLLGRLGHETRVAYSGPEGVNAATARNPDVVVCAIGLPGLDGYGVAREIRLNSTAARVRLVALTGYGSDEDRLRSQGAGFDYHLVKPADPKELQRLLEAR